LPAEDLKKCFGCDERTEFDRLRYEIRGSRWRPRRSGELRRQIEVIGFPWLAGETAVWSHSVYRIRGQWTVLNFVKRRRRF